MSMKDDADGSSFDHVFAKGLRHFDNQLSDFRQFYESHSMEERKQLRDWLEKVDELQQTADWNMDIKIHAENDVFDDNGELIRWADATFSPRTMLSAISAWDQGDDFAPSTELP